MAGDARTTGSGLRGPGLDSGIGGPPAKMADEWRGGSGNWSQRIPARSNSLHLEGVEVSSNYTLGLDDDRSKVVVCDASAAAFTVTLPPASSSQLQHVFIQYSDATYQVTVAPDGSDTIGGESSQVLTDTASLHIWAWGTDWRIL